MENFKDIKRIGSILSSQLIKSIRASMIEILANLPIGQKIPVEMTKEELINAKQDLIQKKEEVAEDLEWAEALQTNIDYVDFLFEKVAQNVVELAPSKILN